MFLEPFDSYIEALRCWDGSSPRPKSIYERALSQCRDLFADGDKNYVLMPGSMLLLHVVKNGERLSVIEMKSSSFEALSSFFEKYSDKAAVDWLALCFFETENEILYDSFYDSLPIRDGNDESIKQYMEKLQELSLPILQLPEGAILAFADEILFPKPLRFLLRQRGISAIHYDSSAPIPDDVSIEPAFLKVEFMTSCGPLVPDVGREYRLTNYDTHELPSYAPEPEELYQITIGGNSHRVFYYMVRFESDCFGNITVFSSTSRGPEKVTPLF